MEDVTNIYLSSYKPSVYTTPCTMYYVQNGTQKNYDIFAECNGVVIVIYNKTRKVLVLVKQFRASVYLHRIPAEHRKGHIDLKKYRPKLGITLEWCSGREDKDIPSAMVAKEEIMEECGYDVELDQLEEIGARLNLSVSTGAKSTFYYCEVTDDMIEGEGGSEYGENIEVVEMPVEEVIKYAQNQDFVPSPVNFMYGLYWFLYHKYKKENKDGEQ